MANDESVEKCCTSNDTVNNYRYEKNFFSILCSVKNVLKLLLFFFFFPDVYLEMILSNQMLWKSQTNVSQENAFVIGIGKNFKKAFFNFP